MEYLYEKVAYLRGLAEGAKVDESTNEGKLITKIIEVLGDFADSINELNDAQLELDEYVEAIDEDLSGVEDEIYGDDDECECGCHEEDDDYDFIEVECPHCKEFVYLDENLLDSEEEVICPNCHEPIEIEFDDCCCGDDCGCHE